MDLGPFFVDLKDVPLYVEDCDVLRVMQVFEDDGFAPRGLVAANTLKGALAPNSQDRTPALITRIYSLPSHSYECEPKTKVLRTVWSTRREPNALSVVSAVELDGKQLTLCRFGRDACTVCFSLTHLTSGHDRALARAADLRERREATRRRNAHKALGEKRAKEKKNGAKLESLGSVGRLSDQSQQAGKHGVGVSGGGGGGGPNTEARCVILPLRSTLAPILVQHQPLLSGLVSRHALNATVNTQSVVDCLALIPLSAKHGDGQDRGGRKLSGGFARAERLVEAVSAAGRANREGTPDLSLEAVLRGGGQGGGSGQAGDDYVAEAVSPEFRGKLASRGMHKMPTLTALELGNGLDTSQPGGPRFNDLTRHSALASTLLNRKLLLSDSKHLEPSGGGNFRAYATELLSRQYDDFNLEQEEMLDKGFTKR